MLTTTTPPSVTVQDGQIAVQNTKARQWADVLTPDQARDLAEALTVAADEAEKPEEPPFQAGLLYQDGEGHVFLAYEDRFDGVRLWRLDAHGATHGSVRYWTKTCGLNLQPLATASGHHLGADGSYSGRSLHH